MPEMGRFESMILESLAQKFNGGKIYLIELASSELTLTTLLSFELRKKERRESRQF
jgi:hypothetical protein